MSRRSVLTGSILLLLGAGGVAGCGSGDTPKGPVASPSPQSLCARIGTDALRKVLPAFEPDPPGEGESGACVRVDEGQSGLLRITVESPSPATEAECDNLQRDAGTGVTWMGREQLPSVGDFACGTVTAGTDGGVVVTILARHGGTNVMIVHGRTPGDVTTVREAVVDLARTVMRRV